EHIDEVYISRFVTRRLLGPWLPFLGLVLIAEWALSWIDLDGPLARVGLVLAASTGMVGVVAMLVVLARARRAAAALAARAEPSRREFEHALREEAAGLVARGYSGLVAGLTHRPELVDLGAAGFVANPGSCDDVTARSPSWIAMPVFRTVRQMSWVELEGAN